MKRPILMIEDNEQNRYLVKFLLEKNGHEVEIATDGPMGLQMAAAGSYACVLLDIQLPTMDGYEVARHLRQLEPLNGIPVIAVTSYAMTGDREKALAAGCDGYIEKPIDPDRFVAQVECFISQGRMEGAK